MKDKKYYIATAVNCNERGENIVIKRGKKFDIEIYCNTNVKKCFNWIDKNFIKIGENDEYDVMKKKDPILDA